MIGIDTNVLVRLFTQDDPIQSSRVDQLLQELSQSSLGFVPSVVVIELQWVLRSRYGVSNDQFASYIEQLLNSPEIVLEHEAALKQALSRFRSTTADFADCLIERICWLSGCKRTVTFDSIAAKLVGMSEL
jgi:predicted nucleic-acid-binding protein